MADYFAVLAARTLRPEPSVQPRQRVLWEDAAKPMVEAFSAAEEAIAGGARPSAPDEAEPPRRSRRTPTAKPMPPESKPVAQRPERERGKRRSASDQEDKHAAMALAPHPTVRAAEPTVQVRLERVAGLSGDAPGKRPVVTGNGASAIRASGIERARPLSTRMPVRERESTAEPAIRIHIGRVDVRAVTTAASVASARASRDSSRALMSLDEYVQKRDRGAS